MDKKLNTEFIEEIFYRNNTKNKKCELIKQCFDISDEIIIAISLEGKIIYVNNKGSEILGYTKAEVRGKSFINKHIPNINLYLFNNDLRFVLAEGKEMKNMNHSNRDFEGKTLDEISSIGLQKNRGQLFKKAIRGEKGSNEYKIYPFFRLIHHLFCPIQDFRIMLWSHTYGKTYHLSHKESLLQ